MRLIRILSRCKDTLHSQPIKITFKTRKLCIKIQKIK